MASGIHEIPSPRQLWQSETILTSSNESGGARERRSESPLPRDLAGHYQEFHSEWDQYDSDAVCSETSIPVGPQATIGTTNNL